MLALRNGLYLCRNLHISRSISVQTFSFHLLAGKRTVTSFDPKHIVARHYNDIDVNEKVQNKYRELDNISKDYVVVYRAPLVTYVKVAHYVSFYCGTIFPCVLSYNLAVMGTFRFPIFVGELPLCRNFFEFTTFAIGLYLLVSQLYLIALRFPSRIYHDNKGNYVAVQPGFFPWSVIKHEFKAGQVEKSSALMPWWSDILYKVNSRYMILFEDHFHRPADYNAMLGANLPEQSDDEED